MINYFELILQIKCYDEILYYKEKKSIIFFFFRILFQRNFIKTVEVLFVLYLYEEMGFFLSCKERILLSTYMMKAHKKIGEIKRNFFVLLEILTLTTISTSILLCIQII